jgi:hypothetical protein
MEIRLKNFAPTQLQLYRFLCVMKLKRIVQSLSDEISPFHTSKRSSKQRTQQTTDEYRDEIFTSLTKREQWAEKFCCKLPCHLFVTQQFKDQEPPELYTKTQPVPRSKHSDSVSVIKTSQLMLYREIIAICSECVIVKLGGIYGNQWAVGLVV